MRNRGSRCRMQLAIEDLGDEMVGHCQQILICGARPRRGRTAHAGKCIRRRWPQPPAKCCAAVIPREWSGVVFSSIASRSEKKRRRRRTFAACVDGKHTNVSREAGPDWRGYRQRRADVAIEQIGTAARGARADDI